MSLLFILFAVILLYVGVSWVTARASSNKSSHHRARTRHSYEPGLFRSVSPKDLPSELKRLKESMLSKKTLDGGWRIEQLLHLCDMLREHKISIAKAIVADLGRQIEDAVAEVVLSSRQIHHLVSLLKSGSYTTPQSVYTPLFMQFASSEYSYVPRGVVAAMIPWNTPVFDAMTVLSGAIAGGNAVCLQLSPQCRQSSMALATLLPRFVDPRFLSVEWEGGQESISAICSLPFDMLYYSGNSTVGKMVYEAAAKQNIPSVLQLNGRNPVILDENSKIPFAARRIAWGKWFNAGQTGLAPNHVFVHESKKREFIEELKKATLSFFGSNPKNSPSYSRLISEKEARRMQSLISKGRIAFGGEIHPEERYCSPTVIEEVEDSSLLMTEEIFGPVLPIITYKNMDDVIKIINADDPMAIYLFTDKEDVKNRVIESTRSGAVVINDVVFHSTNPRLPFGGVGGSGKGTIHGDWSFEAFSRPRAVLRSFTGLEVKVRYWPLTPLKSFIFKSFTFLSIWPGKVKI